MFFNTDETMPQFVDRFLARIALAVTIMGASYGAGALTHLVDGGLREFLNMVRHPVGLLAALIILPMFIKMMITVVKCRGKYQEPSGYIAEIYGKSAANGFAAGFIFLVLLEPFSGRVLSDMPPQFFVQAAIAVMLGALGISFFILNRGGDDEMDDDEFGDQRVDEGHST
jgi:hypothetical protein